jgi:hypothetical protein
LRRPHSRPQEGSASVSRRWTGKLDLVTSPDFFVYRAMLAVLVLALGAGVARAATPSGLLGYEYSAGGGGQETHVVMAVGALDFGTADLLLGGLRFRDRSVGSGGGLVLGGGVPLGRAASFRVLGSRFVAEDDFSAWRIRLGPLMALPSGGRTGIFLTRQANNRGSRVDGGAWEIAMPLSPRTEGSLTTFYGRSDADEGFGAAVGLLWRAMRRLEISGELGLSSAALVARRGALLTGSGPDAVEEDRELSTSTSLAVRTLFP